MKIRNIFLCIGRTFNYHFPTRVHWARCHTQPRQKKQARRDRQWAGLPRGPAALPEACRTLQVQEFTITVISLITETLKVCIHTKHTTEAGWSLQCSWNVIKSTFHFRRTCTLLECLHLGHCIFTRRQYFKFYVYDNVTCSSFKIMCIIFSPIGPQSKNVIVFFSVAVTTLHNVLWCTWGVWHNDSVWHSFMKVYIFFVLIKRQIYEHDWLYHK